MGAGGVGGGFSSGSGMLTEQQKASVWFIKEADKEIYMKFLVMHDTNKTGNLTDKEMQQVMLKTQLDKKTCARVWDLSNPKRATVFDRKMFFLAMHLMYKKRQDPNLELPATVPPELDFSAGEGQGQMP